MNYINTSDKAKQVLDQFNRLNSCNCRVGRQYKACGNFGVLCDPVEGLCCTIECNVPGCKKLTA